MFAGHYHAISQCKQYGLKVGEIYPFGTIYVISEGEEGVRADSDSLQRANPVLLFSL